MEDIQAKKRQFPCQSAVFSFLLPTFCSQNFPIPTLSVLLDTKMNLFPEEWYQVASALIPSLCKIPKDRKIMDHLNILAPNVNITTFEVIEAYRCRPTNNFL
jgi:hypothetical protein